MLKNSKILICGHTGLVGSALVRTLLKNGYTNLLYNYKDNIRINLINQADVFSLFGEIKPDFVFLAAARMGGIYSNDKYSAEFIYNNLSIQTNVIHACYLNNIKKLLHLGSSCVYPKLCPQPIKEEYLLTGELEKTNEAYSVSKIAGIKMCQHYRKQYGCNFISCQPTNLFGRNDTYHESDSHVIPSLIYKIHKAKVENFDSVVLWGTGKSKREFLYVDDMAEACLFLMNNYNEMSPINVGSDFEFTILELSEIIKNIIGYKGKIIFDTSFPDGTPRKKLDCLKINRLGWVPRHDFIESLKFTYSEYLKENPVLNASV